MKHDAKSTTTERQREIDQGLRKPSGELIGGLHVEDYVQGHKDFKAGTPAPNGLTSVSYDLGRHRAAQEAEQKADILRKVEERNAASQAKVRELIAHRSDLLAEYDAKMEALSNDQ